MSNTIRYLSRHELGMKERVALEEWKKFLHGVCKTGNVAKKRALGITDLRHFEIELSRVNKFIKNLPK